MSKIDPNKLQNFERAFSDCTGGCRRVCHCGKEYFDNYNGGYSWEDGELEALQQSKTAVPLDYAVGDISFEGNQYVDACDCWHKRATQIMGFLDGHAEQIAKYLTLEKKRKQQIADNSPVVSGD